MATEQDTANGLDGFGGWEAAGTDEDFFRGLDSPEARPTGAEAEPPEAPQGAESAEAPPLPKGKAAPEGKKEAEAKTGDADDDLYGGPDGDPEEDLGDGLSDAALLRALHERGLVKLDGDIGDGEAPDLLADKFEEAVEARVEELFGGLPEPVRQLNRYVVNGGDFAEFVSRMAQGPLRISEDMDLDDEDAQEAVLREALREEGSDEEEIEAQLEFLKDSGRMASLARKKHAKWLSRRREAEEQAVRQQVEAKKLEKERAREARRRVSALLEETGSIGPVQVSRTDRRDLPAYVGERSVALQNGTAITPLQRDLFYELPKNEKALLQLALLVRNRNADGTFNFGGIAREAEEKVAREVRASVRRTREAMPHRSKEGGRGAGRALAEYFS